MLLNIVSSSSIFLQMAGFCSFTWLRTLSLLGTYKVPLVFGSAGLSMKFEESIELSHVIPVNYLDNPYFRLANVTDVNVSASVEAGINLWIARAAAGIRGGVSARFDAAAQWDPSSIYGSTLSNNKAGIKFRLNAFLQAYAEARFLFWSKRWEHTIASIDHTWYVPDSDFRSEERRVGKECDGGWCARGGGGA